jgi:hypothetical protein
MEITRPPIETVHVVDNFASYRVLSYYNVDMGRRTVRMGDLFCTRGTLMFSEDALTDLCRLYWTLDMEVLPGMKGATVWIPFWTVSSRDIYDARIPGGCLRALGNGVTIKAYRQQRLRNAPEDDETEALPCLRKTAFLRGTYGS